MAATGKTQKLEGRLAKVGQEVECELPGYEDVKVWVWVNAPNKVFERWNEIRDEALAVDDDGQPVYETDKDGQVVVDDETYEPVRKVDQAKLVEAAQFFVTALVMDFSIKFDQDGNPLSVQDPDFFDRVPEDLIAWLYDAVAAAVAERRKRGKGSARLAGIIGR